MRASILRPAIFGSFDGMISVFGVIAGLLNARQGAIVSASVGLAVASSLGMAFGEYQADPDRSYGAASAMGVATLLGTVTPMAGFFFLPKPGALGWLAAACLLIVGLIAHQRRAWLRTYAIFVLVAAATLGISLLMPGGA